MIDGSPAPKKRFVVLEVEEAQGENYAHPRPLRDVLSSGDQQETEAHEGEIADDADEMEIDAAGEPVAAGKKDAADDRAMTAVKAEQALEKLVPSGAAVQLQQEAEHTVVVIPKGHISTPQYDLVGDEGHRGERDHA